RSVQARAGHLDLVRIFRPGRGGFRPGTAAPPPGRAEGVHERGMNVGRLVHLYVLTLGALLLLEGCALLVADRLPVPLGLTVSDTRHNLLHIVWGAALLGVVVMARGSDRVAWAALIFGLFYVGLAVLGVTLDRP